MNSSMSHNEHNWPSMASHTQSHEETKPQKFTAVNAASYLRTPDEPNAHSFSQEETTEATSPTWQTKLPPLQAATPPASPLPGIASATGYTQDRPLFPEPLTDRRRSQTPLFSESELSPIASRARAASSGNVDTDRSQEVQTVTQPQSDARSGRTLSWPSFGVSTGYEARVYFHARIKELEKIPRVRPTLPAPTKSRSPERDDMSQQQLRRLSRPSGVAKSRPQPKSAPRPKAPAAASPVQRTATPRRQRTPKARTLEDFQNVAFPSSQPGKHKRAPPSKKVGDHGVHWTELVDYSPPTDSLDKMDKKLTTQPWTAGGPKDISKEPEFDQLHPQEQHIASLLRLEPTRYLYNKRKIFAQRLQYLRDGKNFTRTAAQGVCDIDVNKASRLHEVFSGVGWFDESWFRKFL